MRLPEWLHCLNRVGATLSQEPVANSLPFPSQQRRQDFGEAFTDS